MTADIIQAQYDSLDAVAARFGRGATESAELRKRVARCAEALEHGGWEGRGAAAFFGEMHGELYPALQRMTQALETARSVTLEAKEIMRRAEEEAAGAFQSDGSGKRDRSLPNASSDGLRVTAMKPLANGELFITDPKDGRAIHPSDASQGTLGDCYFVTSLSVIAQQNPDLIKKAIRQNSNGTYTVTFYHKIGGLLGIGTHVEPVEVTVSPSFPVGTRMKNGKPFPVDPHISVGDVDNGKQEMWAMVMEKAYAQWKGHGDAPNGYAALDEGGNPGDALFALTGQKSTNKDPDDYKIGDLARMQRDGYAIALSSLSSAEASKKALYKNGLVTDHAYYISNIDEKTGLVTVQNPWGWDQNKVTMSYADMQKNFSEVTINPLIHRK